MSHVRRAMEEDMSEILVLARRFHAESPVHRALSFSEQKVSNLIRTAFEDPAWLPIVAVDDQGIIGIGLFWCLPEFYSEDRVAGDIVFYVAPDRRGSWAAIKMLDYVVEWARAAGALAYRMGIHTGINHDQAVRFFEKRGLKLTGFMMTLDLT